MTKEILRQRTWNAGEVDPDLIGRDDVKVSANAGKYIENCLCIPQGPLVRRPGLSRVDVARHPIAPIDATAAAWSAPNGGVAANAKVADGTALATTADLGTTHPYVVAEIDFAGPVAVYAVDVIDYGLVTTSGAVPPAAPPIQYPWGGGGFYLGGLLP